MTPTPSSAPLYQDPWITIDTVPATTASGREFLHRRILTGEGSGTLILPTSLFRGVRYIGLVRQPRPAPGLRESWELPRGGAVDASVAEASRELVEETGLLLPEDAFTYLGVIHPDTGLMGVPVYTFLARVPWEEAQASEAHLEEESGARPAWRRKGEVFAMAGRGEITCAMTLATLLKAEAGGHLQEFYA